MAAPHRIRLHGPWTVQSSLEGSIPHTVPMPGPIPPSGPAESKADANPDEVVILERSFGLPTNLEDETEVDLVVEEPAAGAEFILNGAGLKSRGGPPFRCGIRNRLKQFNLLWIVLTGPAPGTVPFGTLRLEITDGQAP